MSVCVNDLYILCLCVYARVLCELCIIYGTVPVMLYFLSFADFIVFVFFLEAGTLTEFAVERVCKK